MSKWYFETRLNESLQWFWPNVTPKAFYYQFECFDRSEWYIWATNCNHFTVGWIPRNFIYESELTASRGNQKKWLLGWIFLFLRIHPKYDFFKIKILKFLGIQPNFRQVRRKNACLATLTVEMIRAHLIRILNSTHLP